MHVQSHKFKELAIKAINDSRLQENLRQIGEVFRSRRDQAFSQVKHPEALKERAREVKERAMAQLPALLEELEKRVKKAGGHVHWAKDAREANSLILAIAKMGRVRSVVKGKSMVTEEIGLNTVLERNGIHVWETDLGEFIIQLAGEPPSHIIGPALHKNKEEIALLFSEKLGIPYTNDPEQLTMAARGALRERFLNADMGITGSNMAVAETGSIVLVENEGNIRFCSTLPRIHVSIMGIEKVVQGLEDMVTLLEVLPRSATGQRLSVYTSILTGPRRQNELDGPEEFHLILLDNGRAEIFADLELREILYCLRCGACLNVCPVYLKAGGHSYGWVYSGPMGSVLSALLLPNRLGRELPFASTLCGACKEVCPVKIDLPRLLIALRQRLAEEKGQEAGIRFLQGLASTMGSAIMARPTLYHLFSTTMKPPNRLLHLLDKRGVSLASHILPWVKCRSLPLLKEPFSKKWPKIKKELAEARTRQ